MSERFVGDRAILAQAHGPFCRSNVDRQENIAGLVLHHLRGLRLALAEVTAPQLAALIDLNFKEKWKRSLTLQRGGDPKGYKFAKRVIKYGSF